MDIRLKKLSRTAIEPIKSTLGAAGYDLCADVDKPITVYPGECTPIPTGLALEIPEGYFGGIFARSGLATRQGLRPPMCVGVIDSDYRGDVNVALYNDSDCEQLVMPHSRIAQLIIMPCMDIRFLEAEMLTATKRGQGGFGSTGVIV